MPGIREAARERELQRGAAAVRPAGLAPTHAMAQPAAELKTHIEALGPWFHNLRLGGHQTAPAHALGDFPADFFQHFSATLPSDLHGWTVLDIGCNAGFYAFEMKRRGAAEVVAIDTDERYLRQARFAAEHQQLDVDFRRLSVYEVPQLRRRFDLVLFLGVIYHLRHPLLALDVLRRFAVGRLLVFQTLLGGSYVTMSVEDDYSFGSGTPFEDERFPRMHFIEHRYADDDTNWWVPNRGCAEALLRSSGFTIVERPVPEVWLCRPDRAPAELPMFGMEAPPGA